MGWRSNLLSYKRKRSGRKPVFVNIYLNVDYNGHRKSHSKATIAANSNNFKYSHDFDAADQLHAHALGMLCSMKAAVRKHSKIKVIMVHVDSRRLAEILWPFHAAMSPRRIHQKVIRQIEELESMHNFSFRVKSTQGKYSPNYVEMFKNDPIIIKGMKELGIETIKQEHVFGVE